MEMQIHVAVSHGQSGRHSFNLKKGLDDCQIFPDLAAAKTDEDAPDMGRALRKKKKGMPIALGKRASLVFIVRMAMFLLLAQAKPVSPAGRPRRAW
jgi:hypothetical protein